MALAGENRHLRECGQAQVIPDGDWNENQKPAIEAWEHQHAQGIHGGEEVSAWTVDPGPLRDREYVMGETAGQFTGNFTACINARHQPPGQMAQLLPALAPADAAGLHRGRAVKRSVHARRCHPSRVLQDREANRFLRDIAAGRDWAQYTEPPAAERGRQGVQPLPGTGGLRVMVRLRAGRAVHSGPVTTRHRRLLAAPAALLEITSSAAGLARLSWFVTHASPPAKTGLCGVRARPAAARQPGKAGPR